MPRRRLVVSLALLLGAVPACSAGDATPPSAVRGCPPGAEVLSSAEGLRRALATAGPGDAFALASGHYDGTFDVTRSGTRASPIRLCGTRDSVLDGGGTDHGYTLHLDGASHWELRGFAVTGGQKGVVLDGSSDNVLSGLHVTGVGDEAVHLRSGSSDNLLERSFIADTGLREPAYGEGIYVGSAESNWCEVSACEPDRSDGNRLVGNTVTRTTAEAVDVKEGTTGGTLAGNRLSDPGADSAVDLKGNGWTVRRNRVVTGRGDAVQVHVVLDGWGRDNRIVDNEMTAPRYAVSLVGAARDHGNVVGCAQVAGATGGENSNVRCR
ncbi:right-handed parallel beta-helix repeat-containing protein [Nocardioides sp. LS1]|uniref:right-handed parallel beta-helix repeat-containing protein n=1 Tax=Nocardioides sp. LS1 TaxID=1027620 RepID=UPI00163A8E8E|nr:right-handed parallel beta-helix repeat-containing protein [Nocardioides sp. LS1]